jgi:hypothetical protein
MLIESLEEGRKEDGNLSIADKIIKKLKESKMTISNNYGRWAWELLQNAKDSVADTDRKVNVVLDYTKDKVIFAHTGNYFTEKDIRGLINQITSKEVELVVELSLMTKFYQLESLRLVFSSNYVKQIQNTYTCKSEDLPN